MSAITEATTWVVIPAHNEEKYLGKVLEKVLKRTPNLVVVDDGSSDKTYDIARSQAPHVLRHVVNLGKGAALKTGCEYVFSTQSADAVIFVDADDQHDIEELKLFTDKLRGGSEIVLGVRQFSTEMPLLRKILNKLASYFVLVLFGRYIPDIPSGYKALTHKSYQQLKWLSVDYAVEMEIAARIAKRKIPFDTIQIKTIYHDLDRGMTLLDTLAMITQIFIWRFTL